MSSQPLYSDGMMQEAQDLLARLNQDRAQEENGAAGRDLALAWVISGLIARVEALEQRINARQTSTD